MTNTAWRERLHPAAWWWWGALVAAVAVAVPPTARIAVALGVIVVVWSSTSGAMERRAFWWTLRFALAILLVRVVLQLLLGGGVGIGEVLLALPQMQLPFGIQIGGDLHASALGAAVDDGSALASVVLALGAASTLCHPSLLLGVVPPRLRGFGLLLSSATNFIPTLAADAARLNRASRWRGESKSRLGWLDGRLLPLSESALERSLRLGASIHLRRGAELTHRGGELSGSFAVISAATAVAALAMGAQPAIWLSAFALSLGLFAHSAWSAQGGTRSFRIWDPTSFAFLAVASALAWLAASMDSSAVIGGLALALLPLAFAGMVRRD